LNEPKKKNGTMSECKKMIIISQERKIVETLRQLDYGEVRIVRLWQDVAAAAVEALDGPSLRQNR